MFPVTFGMWTSLPYKHTIMKRLVHYVMSFSIFFTVVLNAAAKEDTPEMIWEQIKAAANQEDHRAVKTLCENLIVSTKPYDSLAVISRNLLAEMSLYSTVPEEVYESYAFFHRYNLDHPEDQSFVSLETQLKTAYEELIAFDAGMPLSEGIYFSDFHNKKYQPLVLVKITRNGDKWHAKLLDGCQVMLDKKNKKYGGLRYPGEIKGSSLSDTMLVVWEDSKVREPLTELANTITVENQKMKAEGHGTVAAYSTTIKESILGTLFVEGVGMVFDLIAGAISRGKIVGRHNELYLCPTGDGKLSARLDVTVKVMTTDDAAPRIDKMAIDFNLYKLYPHQEIFFFDSYYNNIITSGSDAIKLTGDEFKRFRYFHPSQFNPMILAEYKETEPCSINRVTKLMEPNGLAYKSFALQNYFPSVYNDPMVKYMPDFTELKEMYYDGGNIAIGKWSNEHKAYDEFMAVYYSNTGKIVYSQVIVDNPIAPVVKSCYLPNGEYAYGQFEAGVMNGSGSFITTDEELLEGRFVNGELYQGTSTFYTDDFLCRIVKTDGQWSTFAEISYANGDRYIGQYKNFRPHGKGMLVTSSGQVIQSEWKDGFRVVTKTTGTAKKRR